jgi:GAF domain-containing protein
MGIGGIGANQLISLFEDRIFSDDTASQLLLRIAAIARELFQADVAIIFARNSATGSFDPTPLVSGSLTDVERAELTPPRAKGTTQQVVGSRLQFVEDLESEDAEQYRSPFTRVAEIRSFAAAALPVRDDQEPLCVLYLDYRSPHAFPEAEREELHGFADQAALVLRSRMVFDGLRRVRQTGEHLTRRLDSDSILAEAVAAIQEAAAADLVVLYPYDPHTHTLHPPVWRGELLEPARPPNMDPGSISIPARVLERGAALFLREAPALFDELELPADHTTDLFPVREQIRSVAVLPLVVGDDDRVGVLIVNYRRPQPLDAAQVEVVQGLSNYAAIAIRNSAVFRGMRDQEMRRLKLLQSIDRQITSTLDLDEVLQATLEQSAAEVGAEEASILLYDPEKDVLDTVAAVGQYAAKSRTQRLPLSRASGITRHVFQTGEPVRVGDLPNDPRFAPMHVEVAPGIRSELDIPLLHEGRMRGVMNYESSRVDAFSESHQDFVTTLAEHAILAILNADTYERERRTVTELSILADVSERIAARAELDEVFELILDEALRLTGASAGELMLVRPKKSHLERVAGRGDIPPRMVQGLDEGIIGWVVTNREPFVGDIRVEPWLTLYNAAVESTQSEMCVPLLSGTAVLGALDVESPEPEHFRKDDIRLLEALARLAVVAITNADSEERADIQLRRFQVLHKAGVELGRITRPGEEALEEAYQVIVRIAQDHTRGEVVVRRYEPATRTLVVREWAHVQKGEIFDSLSVDQPCLNAQVFRERRTIVVPDTRNPPDDVEAILLSDDSTRSLLIAPIGREGDRYYGNLALAHHETDHFLDTDLELFDGLAQLLALTIQRIEMSDELRAAQLRATAAEAVVSMNEGAAELAHRLSRVIPTAPSHLQNIREALRKASVLDNGVGTSLELVERGIRTVITLGQSLSEQAEAFRAGGDQRTAVPLQAILQEIRNGAPHRPEGVELVVDDWPDEGVMLHVVPRQIVSIVSELMGNAIHAVGRTGRIEVRARITRERVEIDCTDTGKGIPLDRRESVFLPFYSTKGGSGLGLWMGRLVAISLGGGLDITPSDHGTTFTLWLPRVTPVTDSRARQG